MENQPAFNRRSVRILALAAFSAINVLYLLSCMQRTAIPGAFFNELQGDLGLSASQVTRAGSLYVYCYATFQIFAGMLVDRFGAKRTAIAGGLLLSTGLFIFSSAHTAGQLYLSRVISAIGQAFFYLCVVKVSHLLFPPRQFGALVAISMAIGFAGSILGTMPAQAISQLTGWRHLFDGLVALCFLSIVITATVLSGFHEKSRKSGEVTFRTVANLFNERGRFCFVTYNFFCYPAYFVLQAVLGQKFIQDYLGCTSTQSACFTLMLTVGSAVFCILGAPLLRRAGGRRKAMMLASNAIPVAVSLAMMAGIHLSAGKAFFMTSFAAMSAYQMYAAASSALMGEITDSRTIAFTAAVRNFFPYVGAGIMGAICGRIMDAHASSATVAPNGSIVYPDIAYIWALVAMFAFALAGLIMTFGIPETRGKRIWQAP